MLLAAFGAATLQLVEPAQQHRLEVLRLGHEHIFQRVQDYHLQTGTWPSSLVFLASQPGFFDLKGYVGTANGGGLPEPVGPWSVHRSNTYALAGLQDQRAAVLTRASGRVTEADLLAAANNQCEGATPAAFDSAVRWCSASTDALASDTTRLELAAEREQRVLRQHATLSEKIMRYRHSSGLMPGTATATNLSALVSSATGGVVGTGPATCDGIFHWVGIAMECSDLYNAMGNPIRYRRISATQFELSSLSSIPDSSGAPRTLSVTYTLS